MAQSYMVNKNCSHGTRINPIESMFRRLSAHFHVISRLKGRQSPLSSIAAGTYMIILFEICFVVHSQIAEHIEDVV
jgi:hypothetical protein